MYRCGFSDYTSHLEEDHIYVEGYTEPPKNPSWLGSAGQIVKTALISAQSQK